MDPFAAGFAAIRSELGLPSDFADDVRRQAATASAGAPGAGGERVDRTDLPLLTIDPPGSRDLDQAMALERRGDGFRVHYAIADVGAFVPVGSPLDREARTRVQTHYLPDGRVPLYPSELSEGAASLLPGETRPAVLWSLDVAADGQLSATDVRRALVRSRRQLDYGQAQELIDSGRGDETLLLLREVGRLRVRRQWSRGGVDLRLPSQEIEPDGDGWTLTYREQLPVEDWNAQISQLTGIAAARLMAEHRLGLLRVLPPPDDAAVAAFRRSAAALDVDWPAGATYRDVLESLDPARATHAALLHQAPPLFRGAGYAAFDGELPPVAEHAGVAAPYAHATAPLRRLGDRYVLDTCVALHAGRAVPDDVRTALAELPPLLTAGAQRAGAVERAAVDLVEAVALRPHVGETFAAVVVDGDDRRSVVQLREPAVRAPVDAPLPLGERVRLRLASVDPVKRRIELVAVTP